MTDRLVRLILTRREADILARAIVRSVRHDGSSNGPEAHVLGLIVKALRAGGLEPIRLASEPAPPTEED